MNKKVFFYIGGILLLMTAACSRPVAKFSYKGELKAPAEVVFENESEKAETYEWDFGDGATSSEASPSHRYRQSGNYVVRLKAMKDKKARVTEEQVQILAPDQCLVEIETPFGAMLVELFDATPEHRDNFVKLTREGYFDDLLFHRVIDGFMIQGGDPNSRNAPSGQPLGTGGPGYTLPAEFVDTLAHVKGVLAAARTGGPSNPEKRSSGSQFYIVQGKSVTEAELNQMEGRKGIRYPKNIREAYLELGGTPFLDQEYTVFGRVIEGLEVIDRIAEAPTDARDRPQEDVWMKIYLIN
jgi:peptidyl-prolyl cis-trans isomerase B (cyclophilin B)